MAFDISAFRANFPEFNSTEKYPNSMVEMWAGLAERQVRSCIWKNTTVLGQSLYIAHELVLSQQNAQAASLGGSPGQQGGIANSKTVGSASIGFDSTSSSEEKAGWWNLTTYGKQFYRLTQIFGAGAITV